MLHVHKWSEWKDVELVYSSVRRAPTPVDGQERRCSRCGKRQRRVI